MCDCDYVPCLCEKYTSQKPKVNSIEKSEPVDGVRFNLKLAEVRLKEINRMLDEDDPKSAYNLLCETQKVLDDAAIETLRSIE